MILNEKCEKILTVRFLELLRTQGAADIPPEVCPAETNVLRLSRSVLSTGGKKRENISYLCARFSCE